MVQFEGAALPGDLSGKGTGMERGTVPKIVGGFNIPKATIENKVDVLTFLELLVRKGMTTPQEIDEIREIVVQYLNGLYPELNLSYTAPGSPAEAMAGAGGQKGTGPMGANPASPVIPIANPLAGGGPPPRFATAPAAAPVANPARPAPRPAPKPAQGTPKPKSSSLFGDLLPPES